MNKIKAMRNHGFFISFYFESRYNGNDGIHSITIERGKVMERRRQARISNIGKIESFNFQHGNEIVQIDTPIEISLKDISLGGLGIISSNAFDVDTTLSIGLILEEESFVVIGKIVWCQSMGAYYESGLKLIYMPHELNDLITDVEYQSQKYSN